MEGVVINQVTGDEYEINSWFIVVYDRTTTFNTNAFSTGVASATKYTYLPLLSKIVLIHHSA